MTARRSDLQNRKMRAMLNDVSRRKPEGRELLPEQWKVLLFAGWDYDRRFGDLQLMKGLEGRPPVPLNGYHTSLLDADEMNELIAFIDAYAARHGVTWSGGEHDMGADPLVLAATRYDKDKEWPSPAPRPLHKLRAINRDPIMRSFDRG